jgi:hypothetical protein
VLQWQPIFGDVTFDQPRDLARADANPLLVENMLQFDRVDLAIDVVGLQRGIGEGIAGLNGDGGREKSIILSS